MRIAVIDLGTNTFNLLIADIGRNGEFIRMVSDRIPVKLGEGTINHGLISDAAYQRGIDALRHYKETIDKYNVEAVRAFATSAIRDASNGKTFVEDALKYFGFNVEVIDGEREAELIYRGVTLAVKLNDEPVMIMDIGGGSIEFIICNSSHIFWKKSYPIGAARLLEKFKPENPISVTTKNAINNFLEETLKDLISAIHLHKPTKLIGSSGAFDSFVDMIAAEKGMDLMDDETTEYKIELSDYKVISAKTIKSTLEERTKTKGLIPIRVDMIVLSYLLADFILQAYNFSEFIVSTFSLKEGVICETLRRPGNNAA